MSQAPVQTMAAVKFELVPTPLAVIPDFNAQSSTTLVMKESIFSLTEPFTVKALDGDVLFKTSNNALSLSSRKRVYDVEDKHLFTLHKEILSFPGSFYAESPTGTKIFEIEGKLHFGSSKAVGHFLSFPDGEQEKLEMKGNFSSTKTEIKKKKNGQVVAQINRQRWNAMQLLVNCGTYAVTIAQGVDMALIIAMVIFLDEKRLR